MTFAPKSTSDVSVRSATKILLYAHHGWGKTTQAKNLQARFGKGFIISGEAGLSSISNQKIDYLPFSSWDGEHDPSKEIYSFKGIAGMMKSPDFAAMGYKWVMLDSLTETSDRLMEKLEIEHKGSKNGFAMWGDYSNAMLGAIKWFRDLPYHVVVTCLAKEESDDNNTTHYWPMVKGNGVQKQIPGIFDNVLCGVRVTEGEVGGEAKVRRFIVTEEVKGWHGKTRDPFRRVKAITEEDNITVIMDTINRTEDEQKKFEATLAAAAALLPKTTDTTAAA